MGKPDLSETRPPEGQVSYLLSLTLAEIFVYYDEDKEDGR
jgi:hypothetical protein